MRDIGGIPMTWPGKLPTETDPLMTQSLRTDFPTSIERQVVDGGVAEGRPAPGDVAAVGWLVGIVLAIMLLVALALNWGRLFP